MDGIFLVMVFIFIYFIPGLVGSSTKHGDGIFLLNLLLGWTILGWIAALIWAVSAEKKIKIS